MFCFFVCSFMFVVFDSVVDCSHHSLPSPLLPHRDSAACRKGPLAMAMASLSKTFSESRTRIIGWSVARSVLADDISQTLVKILPDRMLWKCLQRSKTWSALIFDDQLFSLPFAHSFNALAGLFETPHMNRDFNLQFFSNDDFQFAID